MAANEHERRRWNDERRYSVWPKREQLTSRVTPLLLEAVAPEPGERVVDVGSGGGLAALAAAEAVGVGGAVVGADISEALCRLAEERSAGRANVRFVHADAQTDAIPGGPFDAAMSQFGVMFFDEPVTAFRNLHAHLRPGGRIAFACWQAAEANSWYAGSELADLLPSPEPTAAGKSPAGPFSLADPDATRALLERAGFAEVRRTAHELEVLAPLDAVMDDAQLEFLGIAPADLPEAKARVDDYLGRLRVDRELYRFPLAFQLFAARRP